MNKFIMAVECPVCGSLVKADGVTADFTAPEGVVCLNLFSQETFECDRCGTTIYTGDMEDALYYDEPEDDGWYEEPYYGDGDDDEDEFDL
jgi:hypothetical protein